MSGCFMCEEPLSSYGFEVVKGKDRKICISCSNLKIRYCNNEMGTRNVFEIGSKVYVEHGGDWWKAIIFTIEEVDTPKGTMFNYLCHWEHPDCFNEGAETTESFSWFLILKPRTEGSDLVDKIKELGNHSKTKINKKLLAWINEEKIQQRSLLECVSGDE